MSVRGLKIVSVIAAAVITLLSLCAPTAAAGGCKGEPSVSAQSAVLMDAETGRVLWEKNAHEPMAMASTTKIMSCVIALENADINDIVIVSERAAFQPKVKMFLSPGEKIPLESLLLALMLQSSNDAAVAIAEHVGGSVEGFAEMMNEKARAIGAMETVFVTPNGLDEGDHHSTAYDMAVITRYAIANPQFRRIIGTKEASAASDRRKYEIRNKNRLLYEYEGANGVKTGYTGKAGQCFVGAAKRGDTQLISVVFASGWGSAGREQKWADSKKLLNYGFENFSRSDIIEAGGGAGEIPVTRAKERSVGAVFAVGLKLPVTSEERESARVDIDLPGSAKAPVKRGQRIGTARVAVGESSFDIDIIAEKEIERFDLYSNTQKAARAFLGICGAEADTIEIPEFPEFPSAR